MSLSLNKSFWQSTLGVSIDDMIFISKTSASDSASVSISSGIDATYNLYLVMLNQVVPATDHVNLRMEIKSSSSALDANTAYYRAYNRVSGGSSNASALEYRSTDQTVESSPITLTSQCSNDATVDGSMVAGQIYFYNFRDSDKFNSFRSEIVFNTASGGTFIQTAVTSAMTVASTNPDELSFSFSSGNIGSGDFILYGLKDS